jgi:hypothetical protein
MIGSAAGPIGTALGAVVGAIAGSYAGLGVSEYIDPVAEDSHWREQHPNQPFAKSDLPFEAYANAYRTGYQGYRDGQKFEQREGDLRMEYEGGPQLSEAEKTIEAGGATVAPIDEIPQISQEPLRWEDAREAARAAYERVERGEAHRKKSDDQVG